MFLHPRMHLLLEVRCFEPKKLPGRSRGSSNGGAGPLLRFVEDPFFLLIGLTCYLRSMDAHEYFLTPRETDS